MNGIRCFSSNKNFFKQGSIMAKEERRSEDRRRAFHRRKRSDPKFKGRERRDLSNRRLENERRESE